MVAEEEIEIESLGRNIEKDQSCPEDIEELEKLEVGSNTESYEEVTEE